MLSIVLPTYNESGNLPELLQAVKQAMQKRPFEVIVVDDDSPDKTWEQAETLSKEYSFVRVFRRVGRRGLSSAVVEGFAMAKGDVLLVMDADLQHDPSLIIQLEDAVRTGAELAVASRYMEGGSVGDWVVGRRWMSRIGTFAARKLPNVEVSDPMSGFFAIRRDVYQTVAASLRPTGFKILLELLAALPRGTRTAAVPLHFRQRHAGESKLSMKVSLQAMVQFFRILFKRIAWPLFLLVTLAVLLPLAWRAWHLRLLYTDADVRHSAQATMEVLAAEEGWLLSDIAPLDVRKDGMTVVYRAHHQGRDETTCYDFLFGDPSPVVCAE